MIIIYAYAFPAIHTIYSRNFFSIANHIAEVCVDTCRPGYLEEFMKEFHKEIDNAFRSAIERNNKGE